MYRSLHTFVTGPLCTEWENLEQQLNEHFDLSLAQMVADIAPTPLKELPILILTDQ